MQSVTVVGDAVAKPLLDAWDAMPRTSGPTSASLFAISNGGAPLSTGVQGAHPRHASRT